MEKFDTGAVRSSRIPRYDLIPEVALRRLAERFTGSLDAQGEPDGGALKYGECNWMKGLPTSDVYNHIIEHLIKWADEFRFALAKCGNDMEGIKSIMASHSIRDDDLAGAMWGISVLMHQEKFGMFHDIKFPYTPPPTIAMGEFDPFSHDIFRCDICNLTLTSENAIIEHLVEYHKAIYNKAKREFNFNDISRIELDTLKVL